MDKVKLIGDLCGIIDAQNGIIYAQAMELIQMGGEPHVDDVVEQRQAYEDAVGEPQIEWPAQFCEKTGQAQNMPGTGSTKEKRT